jgi:hypothetical protein
MSDDPMTQWRGLGALAGSGDLTLERGVAERCAKRCAEFANELVRIKEDAIRQSTIEGFGDRLQSGMTLKAKFEKKAAGGDYSMDQAIDDHIKVVVEMQQTFEKIDAMYAASEERGAKGIGSAGAPLDR